MEDEDLDPVGQKPRDPEAAFREIAERVGLIRPGDPMDQTARDFAYGVVELCASIGDLYTDDGANAGEHIRAELGEL
jgi:hypothetical protein